MNLGEFEEWAHERAGDSLDDLGCVIAELEEMLTAATDVAVQRGKRIDQLRDALDEWKRRYWDAAGADD